MAISIESLKRKRHGRPPTIIVYGPDGIGKSSFALEEPPNPVLLPTEPVRDSFKHIPQFDLCTSLEQVDESLDFLLHNDTEFKTLAFDTFDWLEGLIFQRVAKDNNKMFFADIGYGKGP